MDLYVSGDCMIPLLSLDLSTLRMLLEFAWTHSLAAQIAMRKDFSDLQGIDHVASFASLPKLTKPERELLACAQDGTFLNTFKALRPNLMSSNHVIVSIAVKKTYFPIVLALQCNVSIV